MRRRRGTEQEWRDRLSRWPNFNGTITAFCEHEGVHQKAFYTWRKKLAGNSRAKDAVAFVELGRAAPDAVVEVVSAGGVVVRLPGSFDKATLRRVVEVLAES